MIAAGVAIAIMVMVAVAIAQRTDDHSGVQAGILDRERLAASILFEILLAGGTAADEAFRSVRRGAGLAAAVTAGIDVMSWGQRFADLASPQQRMWLLETAVKLVAERTTPVPLRQYTALLDLSFALGFHTDALAKLREQYGFDYIDYAKAARPRDADRAGGSTPLFVREPREKAELLRILGIEASSPSRQEIITAYRRLVAQHHPDRFHEQTAETQSDAAARFIEITRAYESLLLLYRD